MVRYMHDGLCFPVLAVGHEHVAVGTHDTLECHVDMNTHFC